MGDGQEDGRRAGGWEEGEMEEMEKTEKRPHPCHCEERSTPSPCHCEERSDVAIRPLLRNMYRIPTQQRETDCRASVRTGAQ